MGDSPTQIRRWLWLALPLIAIVIALVAGKEARAARNAGAATPDTSNANADNRTLLPYITKAPLPPQLELQPFTVGFDNVTIMDITHAGDERLFIANREGKVWIVNPDGSILEPPFLDVTKLVQHEINFEQGFLGMAFHPDYPATPYFYFAYTSPAHIHIMRGEVSATNPNLANSNSLRTLMSLPKPDASGGPSPVHNAGDLAFGPDGYLYIPIGDGGPDPYDPKGVPGDPNNHSQRRDSLFGKILRIDPDPTAGLPQDCGVNNLYSIPPSNPWVGDNGCDEIWAMGLRNPWRMSIDPLNGDFYIADVGEWLREEVNYLPGGSPGGVNFGWHCWEGTIDYTTIHPQLASNCPAGTTFTFPIHEYDHSQGECSIIGGKVYRGSLFPTLYGYYFFGDWCSGRLWTAVRQDGAWQVEPAGRYGIPYSTFGEDIHGELYAGQYANGTLYKVVVR